MSVATDTEVVETEEFLQAERCIISIARHLFADIFGICSVPQMSSTSKRGDSTTKLYLAPASAIAASKSMAIASAKEQITAEMQSMETLYRH